MFMESSRWVSCIKRVTVAVTALLNGEGFGATVPLFSCMIDPEHCFLLFSAGNFQLVADPVSFETVADLIRSVRLPQSPVAHRSPPRFQNLIPISTDDATMKLRKGETLSLIGFEESQGRRLLRCEVLRKTAPLKLLLPMDCRGHFLECQDDQLYSIDTIVRWKLLAGRKRRVRVQAGHRLRLLSPLVPEHFRGHLVLHPYFSVMAYLPGK